MFVSDEIQALVRRQAAEEQSLSLSTVSPPLSVFLDEDRFKIQLDELESQAGDLPGKKILEVGSGYGMLLAYAHLKRGLDYHGLEPGETSGGRYETAGRLLRENGIDASFLRKGFAEAMPFPDAFFDVVFSFQVLEHVQDPAAALAESWRVLRPGGALYVNAPNYRSFYEGHYHIPWIPGLPKFLAKIYVRLWKRNPDYLNRLNLINEQWLRRTLRRITGAEVQSDFGMADWQSRMKTPVFSAFTDPAMARLVRIGQRMGFLRFLALAGAWIRSQDTLRVTVIKKPKNY